MNITAALVLLGAAGTLTPLALPGGEGGIGFDDLRFSAELHKLLVPAGASGRLDLVDPKTQGVSEIAGFSTSPQRERGHSQGTTSDDSGDGLIFASDRTAGTLATPWSKRAWWMASAPRAPRALWARSRRVCNTRSSEGISVRRVWCGARERSEKSTRSSRWPWARSTQWVTVATPTPNCLATARSGWPRRTAATMA